MSDPVASVIVDGAAVAKANLRAYLASQAYEVNPATVAGLDLAARTTLTWRGVVWGYVPGSTATADGAFVLADANGRRYIRADVPALRRSALINGGFDVWQRGTSFSTPASGSYTADRWRVYCDGTPGTYTVSRQAFTLGQTDVPGEPTSWLRWVQSVVTSGATALRLQQPIEDVRRFAGQTVTVLGRMKCVNTRTITPRLSQYFGTGGSPSATVDTAGAAWVTVPGPTAIWTYYASVIQVPSLAGKTIGTNGDSALIFSLGLPLTQVQTLDIAELALIPGALAATVDWPTPAEELAACRRYYQLATATSALGALGTGRATGTTAADLVVPLIAPMRGAVPTVTSINAVSTLRVSGTALSALSLAGHSDNAVRLTGTVASGLTAGQALLLEGVSAGDGIAIAQELL
ncbi:hypothetical protein [Prosthecomicrobium hirschii]|uniref:hypothetical protein n=1 Tax=Prosthecodimorpha hirschii TaxID=665126 RepID=UPI00221E3832|nr:hypothetical protein [Prosthecomicrobium hirschii]MCW1839432.1 hypothetical protein [Prosthecomicrobium hirschii]